MITAKEFEEIQDGWLVKIVDEWGEDCMQNTAGRMDVFLGQVCTVIRHRGYDEYLEVDQSGIDDYQYITWGFNRHCIDEVYGPCCTYNPDDDFVINTERLDSLIT